MDNTIFSQKYLNQMVGQERSNPLQNRDQSDVEKHPALTSDKEISSHPALTNQFQDLSQLGDPSENPSSTPPQKNKNSNLFPTSEINPNSAIIHEQPKIESLGNIEQINIQSDNQNLNQISGIDNLVLQFMGTILQNTTMSQQFLDQLVSMLCENDKFMTTLKDKILENIIKTSN